LPVYLVRWLVSVVERHRECKSPMVPEQVGSTDLTARHGLVALGPSLLLMVLIFSDCPSVWVACVHPGWAYAQSQAWPPT
jgi:hypothetical protein